MENTGQTAPSQVQHAASLQTDTSVRVFQDPTVPIPVDVPDNDPNTSIKYLNPESGPLPAVSPEFQSAFQDIVQEVFVAQETADKEKAEESEEKRQQEVEALESKLQDLAGHQSHAIPAVQTAAPVSTPVPSAQSQAKAQQVMQALGKKPSVTNSLTWLATLFSKVFKIRGNTNE